MSGTFKDKIWACRNQAFLWLIRDEAFPNEHNQAYHTMSVRSLPLAIHYLSIENWRKEKNLSNYFFSQCKARCLASELSFSFVRCFSSLAFLVREVCDKWLQQISFLIIVHAHTLNLLTRKSERKKVKEKLKTETLFFIFLLPWWCCRTISMLCHCPYHPYHYHHLLQQYHYHHVFPSSTSDCFNSKQVLSSSFS